MATVIRSRAGHAFVVIVLLVAACGGSFTDRAHKTLATSLVAANAARDQFVAWDVNHQQQIVEAAADAESGRAQLAAYRKQRGPVLRAFTLAYTTIAAAAALIPLVDHAGRSESDLARALIDAAAACAAAKTALEALVTL